MSAGSIGQIIIAEPFLRQHERRVVKPDQCQDSHLSLSDMHIFVLAVLDHFENHVTLHLVKELEHKGEVKQEVSEKNCGMWITQFFVFP